MGRRFKPGVRRRYRPDKMSQGRKSWLILGILQVVHYEYEREQTIENLDLDGDGDEYAETVEDGTTVVLSFKKASGRALSFGLTSLTEAEFDKLIEYLKMIEPRIRRTIRLRDKVAQDALEQGDDSFNRVYRPLPRLVVRPGVFGEDDEGIHVGPPPVPGGPGDDDDLDGGLPAGSDELADGEAPSPGDPND